jgi:Uma2 family endonuclease
MSPTTARATLDDLMRADGKAELIGGWVVESMPVGFRPNDVAGRIYRRLAEYGEGTGRGVATTDGMGYAVEELPSGRESFSPNAAYYYGPMPANRMRFIGGPPTFAAEVRSEYDYGPAAELEMEAKRADYFAAGTLVVWDVDPDAREVRKYTPAAPAAPTVFGPGTEADVEPAVPGWRLNVDWLMR